MPPVRPKVRPDLAVVELDGEAIVYDDQARKLHHLNPTATIVLSLRDGRSTIPELSGEIAEAFGLPRDEVERQVRTLLRQFRKELFLDGPVANGAKASTNGKRPVKPAARRNGTRVQPKRSPRERAKR